MAQAARLLATLVSLCLAGGCWFLLGAGWLAIAVAAAVAIVGGVVADFIFRRLATPEDIRADLEDRVRNPPS
jgi:putative flippase GtrA